MIGYYILLYIIFLSFFYNVSFQQLPGQPYLAAFILVVISFKEIVQILFRNGFTNLSILNPLLLTSFITFLLGQGALSIFLLTYKGEYLILSTSYTQYSILQNPELLTKSLSAAGIAYTSLLLGYNLNIGRKLFYLYKSNALIGKILSLKISLFKLYLLVIVTYFVKFYLFANGMYGYQQLATGAVPSRLNILTHLGSIVFFISGTLYFKDRNKGVKILYPLIFGLELIFALAHGARSSIILFFLVFLASILISGKKLRWYYGLGMAFITIFAMTVGLQYKNFIANPELSGKVKDPVTAIFTFLNERKKIATMLNRMEAYTEKQTGIENAGFYYSVARLSYLNETAMAIKYKDSPGLQPEDPSYTYALITAPFFAIFPSYYFFNIQEQPWGLWFLTKVIKSTVLGYSVASSPVGYLYLFAKLPGIIFGFIVIGIILKFTASILYENKLGFIVLFLALLSITYNLDSIVHGIFLNFERYLILIPLVYFFFLAKIRIK